MHRKDVFTFQIIFTLVSIRSHAFLSAKYEEVHKKLESCALVNKTTNACIDILKAEIDSANEEKRVRSAYKCLLEIYMNNTNIDKSWLELFRETLEIAISDRTMKNHIKVFNKYLKILKQLKQYELLLKRSLEMLSMYPNEYIPLDMICYVYVETYHRPGFCFNVSFKGRLSCTSKPILINVLSFFLRTSFRHQSQHMPMKYFK